MKISTCELWVAHCASTGGYDNYDDDAPCEVFTQREAAEVYCAEMTENYLKDPKFKNIAHSWRVESLTDCLWRIRDENFKRGKDFAVSDR